MEGVNCMDNKGEGDFGNLLWEYIIYLLILVVFVFLVFGFINANSNGAGVWEDFYAKELVKVIDSSEAGDSVEINVHKGTSIALKNGLASMSEIFVFDNVKHEICVSLSSGRGSCYFYFKEVAVIEPELLLGSPENILRFRVAGERDIGGENG